MKFRAFLLLAHTVATTKAFVTRTSLLRSITFSGHPAGNDGVANIGGVRRSQTAVAFSPTASAYSSSSSSSSSTSALQALPAFLDGAITTASSASASVTASPLFEYFLQTVISYAVPSFFTIITIVFAAASFRKRRGGDGDDEFSFMDRDTAVAELYSDLYGDSKESSSLGRGGGGFLFGGRGDRDNSSKQQRRNLGIPESEYFKITNWNARYDSYDFSVAQATKSKAYAASKYRNRSFDRALELALTTNDDDNDGKSSSSSSYLSGYAKTKLLEAEQMFYLKGTMYVVQIQNLEARLAGEIIDSELKRLGMEDAFELDPKEEKDQGVIDAEVTSKNNATKSDHKTSSSSSGMALKSIMQRGSGSKTELLQAISKLQRELKQAELDFLQDVIAAVGTKRGLGIRAALLGDIRGRGSGGLLTQLVERPLSAILHAGKNAPESQKKTLFVMNFPGDVQASQLEGLREEVTAVIRNSKPGDEALVILQSGGGTVTGYGLAAGQLVRLKEAGLFLTMAVEQVAASGGYMMACVADRIVASPFAVLGSIGVISEIPNAYERLKSEGIEFQTVTAGKFKRTLTPTKKVSKADLEKSKEDLEQVLGQFSGFVKANRPSLDIDAVATGETWFGNAALDKGLCDDIKTVDDILLNYVNLGYNVLEIEYSPPPEVPQGLAQLLPFRQAASASSMSRNTGGSLPRRAVRWIVDMVAEEVKSVIDEKTSVKERFMAKDDTSDRVQMRD